MEAYSTMSKSTLERAFEIAREGKCGSAVEIRKQLRHERYDDRQLEGPMLLKQLAEVARKARAVGEPS